MPTPLLNLAIAKTLLDQDRSPEAVAQVYDLVAKVVKQQEKATSQRLESDPALCRSSQYKPPRDRFPHDVGSQTGSSEQNGGMHATGRMLSPYPPTTEKKPDLAARR